MKSCLKHLNYETVVSFADQVAYIPGQVVSKTLAQNKAFTLTLFAFDQGEEISSHTSDGDALAIALDGKGEVTINGRKHEIKAGECIVMPAETPHAIFASERCKIFLVVVFPTPESAA